MPATFYRNLTHKTLIRALATTNAIARPQAQTRPASSAKTLPLQQDAQPLVQSPYPGDRMEAASPAPADPVKDHYKTKVRRCIESIKNLTLAPATFNHHYFQLTQTADLESLHQSGLTEKYHRLTDLHASIQKSHEHLQYYARALEGQLQSSTQPTLYLAMVHLEGLQGNYRRETQFFNQSATDFQKLPVSPPPPPHADLLRRTIEESGGYHTIFDAINLPSLTNDDQEVVYPTAADRLAVIEALLPKAIGHTNRGTVGGKLLQNTLQAPHLSEEEKVELIGGLAQLKADLYLIDLHLTPLEVALENRDKEPRVVQVLEELGARLPASETPRITGHFLSIGGSIPAFTRENRKRTFGLEGLSERMAEDGLDPVFKTLLTQMSERASPPMQAPLKATLQAWATISDYPSFITALQSAKEQLSGNATAPSALITGWNQPSGHAVGFVFNQEEEGGYLYACNTGNLKDPDHCVVKYRVVDYSKLLSFFEAGGRERNNTFSFYLSSPEIWGLERCPEEEQLPPKLDRAPQKRGHCPITARKACVLALLWSTSRINNVDPALVKATYKDLTTELRREGAAQATESPSPELKGKALVSLLTKLDRPGFDQLAYQMAQTILRAHGSFLWRFWPVSTGEIPETHSPDYVSILRKALTATGQDLVSITTAEEEDLATYAERRGHPNAARVLRDLMASPV